MVKREAKFKFIDLFAGIGGFHQAMKSLGGECVLASEINPACIRTYKENFRGTKMVGDIREVAKNPDAIEKFDVLCGGFPCQTFSKAGDRKGFQDETRGKLFYSILKIIDSHPEMKYLILENVRNLADREEYWNEIKKQLKKRNFFITEDPIILSPSNFGIPQIRERVYILGIRKDLRDNKKLTNDFIHISDMNLEKLINVNNCNMGDAWKILENDVPSDYRISKECELMIKAWDEFRRKTKIKVIGFPIWIEYFGLNIKDNAYFKRKAKIKEMPGWKQNYVMKNRQLYLNNKEFIDSWIEKYDMLNRIKLYQKFEWNCGEDCKSIKDTIIQVRQSGIRAKRPNYYPSLVAMVNTPIIWDSKNKYFRKITPREAANLQSFDKNYKFTGTDKEIYRQLGNSVNVSILKKLTKKLFSFEKVEN